MHSSETFFVQADEGILYSILWKLWECNLMLSLVVTPLLKNRPHGIDFRLKGNNNGAGC